MNRASPMETGTASTSAATTVNGAAFSKLLIKLPGQTYNYGTGVTGTLSNQVAGTSFVVTVYASDAYDNWVTTTPSPGRSKAGSW